MSAEPTYETQRIDHLGIVAGVCQEISLIEQIDGQVKTSERKVSCGKGSQAMILNALGFVGRALYLTPDYFENKPVDLLIGPELSGSDFNDDTLARCLDDLYEAGVTEVFYKVAAHALQVYGIQSKFVHLDSSSFHLHGAYDRQEPGQEAITITYGYSKDHRPDLKQVVVQLITSYKSALPVWFEALSGNSNDKKTFTATVKAYCKQLSVSERAYVVMDSAGFTAATLKAAEEQDVRWLMRVPETLAQAKQLVRDTLEADMSEIEPGYKGNEVESEYAGVKQRWLIIFSEAAQVRELKTLEKAQAKELEAAQKEWRKIEGQTFNCVADAEQALAQFNKRWKYHQATAQVNPITQYARRGRPSAEDQKEVIGYNLQGSVEVNATAVDDAKGTLGRFIIATNELDVELLSVAGMLENYTDQGISVERGFRFLKDPLFFANSLFLKKPERIMALLMIMGLALLVYFLAERKLRLALKAMNATIPNQLRKPTQTPTIRWVFQMFQGLDILLIHQHDQVVFRKLVNLRPVQQQVITLLGPQVQECYLVGV
jgi:transposase